MKLLILFALLGAAFSLQYPVQYQYRYSGRVSTSIPGISPQVAALGIKARVIVQVRSPIQAVVQIKDVSVGKINENVPSTFLKKVLPISYRPLMQEYASVLELPFAVNFLEDKDRVMDVPEMDKLWMTNIRKSIVEILLLEPIRFNKDSLPVNSISRKVGHAIAPSSFSIEEETIFGRCESQYSITEYPRASAMQVEQSLKEQVELDVQSRKSSPYSFSSSIPKLNEKLWKLVRSINFDKCQERVILQHSSVANTTKAGYGQYNSLQSRSSVGTYILRGTTGSFRVEKAIVEGAVLRNPFGVQKSDKIQCITNQTLALQKVQEIKNPLSLPVTQPVKTWRYEVLSPFSPPFGNSKLWIDYTAKGTKFSPISLYYILLGMKPEPQRLMVSLEEELSKAALELREIPRPPAEMPSIERNHLSMPVKRLQRVSSILDLLPVERVQEVFDIIFRKQGNHAELEQILLVDAAAVSGASAPIKVLLEYMESGKVSSARAATIFITLTNQLSSPAVIPELLEYVKNIEVSEYPYLASAALINLAKLTNRMCYESKRNYSSFNAIYGSESCKKSVITQQYLPYLSQLLSTLSKPHEKIIVLQAISELGSSEALPVLVRAAYGEYSKAHRVRTVAIYALSHERLGTVKRHQVLDILSEIIDQIGEEPEIRQAAIISLISHNPPPSFYHRLARMTWRDPSQQTAAFAYLTLHSLSKSQGVGSLQQADRARYALPLAKPYSPSVMYSYNSLTSRYLQQEQIQSIYGFASIVNMKSYLPKEAYALWETSISGFKFSPIQVGAFAEGYNTKLPQILETLHQLRLKESRESRSHPRSRLFREQEILSEMRRLNVDLPLASNPEFGVLIRMLDNMISYLPLNKQLVKQVAGTGAGDLIKALVQGAKFNLTKYIDPLEVTYFLPTELGLPLISMTRMPTVQYCHGSAKLHIVNAGKKNLATYSEIPQDKRVQLAVKSNYKLISRLESKLMVYSPWDEDQIEAGVENVKVINLPLYVNVSVINGYVKKSLNINWSSITKQAFSPLYTHNIPFTGYKPIVPVPQPSRSSKKIVNVEGRKPLIMRSSAQSKHSCGIDAVVQYSGDVEYPWTSANVMEYLKYPERLSQLLSAPTSRLYQTSITIRPESSFTQNISVSLNYTSGYLLPEEKEIVSKYTPRKSRELVDRLSPLPRSKHDLGVVAVEAGLLLNGTTNNQYQSSVVVSSRVEKATRDRSSVKKYTVSAFAIAPSTSHRSSPKRVYLEAEMCSPNITSSVSLKEKLMSGQLKSNISAQLSFEPNYSPAVEVEGKIRVSSERSRIVIEELEYACQYDKVTPTTKFPVNAIYDEGLVKVTYKPERLPKSFLNASYHAEEAIKANQYPQVYINKVDVHNPPNQIKIQLKSPLHTKYYHVQVEKPRENIVFTKMSLKRPLSMVPYYGFKKSCSVESAILPDVPLSSCKVTKKEIKPFNKQSYPFHPLKCLTKVAYDPLRPEDFVIQVRENSERELEVVASSSEHGISIKISDREVAINGRRINLEGSNKYTVTDSNSNSIAYLFVLPDEHIYAVINQRYVLRLRYSDLHIFDLKTHGNLVGACGSTKSFEMVGPQGCIYRPENSLLLKYAYTKPEGHKCDMQDYESYSQRVQEFQNSCTKKTKYLSGKSGLYAEKEVTCLRYRYPVVKDNNGNLCISEEPVQKCSEKCTSASSKHVIVKMKCWPEHNAPRSLLLAASNGSAKHPISERGQYEITSEIRRDSKCFTRK